MDKQTAFLLAMVNIAKSLADLYSTRSKYCKARAKAFNDISKSVEKIVLVIKENDKPRLGA